MIYPPLSDLMTKVNSRYSLVIGTAKRARQLAEGSRQLVDCGSDKTVTIAINEISQNKVTFKQYDLLYDIYDEMRVDQPETEQQ